MDSVPSPVTPARKPFWQRWWVLLVTLILIAGVTVGIALWGKYAYLRSHADQILRDRIVASLSARFNSPVELDSFHLDIGAGIHATGGGLRILYLAGPTKPDANPNNPAPMITVDHFEFETNFKALLEPTTRIVTVHVTGLDLHVPPHGMGHTPRKLDNPKPQKQPKISLVVDKIVCVELAPGDRDDQAGQAARSIFNLSSITLTDVGAKQAAPLRRGAHQCASRGSDSLDRPFRPLAGGRPAGHADRWRPTPSLMRISDRSRESRASSLRPANLKASSTTSTCEGVTDTPDFRLDMSDHPVPLHTDFTAIVNGTTGDTTLTRVEAQSSMKSVFHCSGLRDAHRSSGDRSHRPRRRTDRGHDQGSHGRRPDPRHQDRATCPRWLSLTAPETQHPARQRDRCSGA